MNLIDRFDSAVPRFLESARRSPEAGDLALFGNPYDCTASFRPGARFGPDAIRMASVGLESFSPRFRRDLCDLPLTDLGNIEPFFGSPEPMVKLVHEVTTALIALGTRPLMLGGDHSVTFGAVSAVAERFSDLVMVQIDAHADLRDGFCGEAYSHASAMRRCLDVLPRERCFQVGIRSGTREEFEALWRSGRLVTPTAIALGDALAPYRGAPLYVTIDLDVFDPSCFPGTGTPEPGGIDWHTFADLLDVLAAHRVVSADVVELAPALDSSGCSSVLAAKVVRELLFAMSEPS